MSEAVWVALIVNLAPTILALTALLEVLRQGRRIQRHVDECRNGQLRNGRRGTGP